MNVSETTAAVIALLLALIALLASLRQFRRKGFLLNNAYIWATPEERRQMNAHTETKAPYYRQSAIAFLLIGVFSLLFAAWLLTHRAWLLLLACLCVLATLVYAIVSTIQLERMP